MAFSVVGSVESYTAKPKQYRSIVFFDSEGKAKIDYFRRLTGPEVDQINDEENTVGENKIYGGNQHEDYVYAIYAYFLCDEQGNSQPFKSFQDVKAIQPVIDELKKIPGMGDHVGYATNYILHGAVMEDNDLLSDEDGSIAQAKKQS